jgi:hypothetical protein
MAQKTDAQLQTQNDTIQTETTANANTASRVGQMIEDVIDSKINNDKIVDEDNMVSDSATLVPSQQSVKAYVDAIGNPAWGNITGTLGDQTDLQTALGLKAALLSPTFTGTPAAPTASAGTSTTQIATTAFAQGILTNTATALTDGASIDITGKKHTLTTTQATITFSQSYGGDFTNIDVTFNTTAATWTFPAGSLCVVGGSASGDNTATIAATSGDKIVISIWFVAASTYRVVVKNFGQ